VAWVPLELLELLELLEALEALEGAVPELKPLVDFAVAFVLVFVLALVLVVTLVSVAAWADPGSARATTPAAATLSALTAAVVVRTRAWPRVLAATARLILSRFMTNIFGSARGSPL
jgi:hypothetical protein